MTSQSPSQPATAPLSGSEITDHLPAEQWVAELLYHCIRSHEERVRELQASTPEYDPKPAYRAIETSGALLDRILGNAGLVGMKRDLTFAYWDRGLQSDAIKAVRSGFAEKVRADGEVGIS